MPFDVAKYPIAEDPELSVVPEQLQDLMLAGRYKVPINTRPFQGFVGLADEESSFTVFSSGLNEFEVLPERNTIAITLLRGVGWLARSDLLTRDGDVGPHIFTPQAQCLGEQIFAYSVYPHGGNLRLTNPHFESDRHTLKFRAVQTNAHHGRLPDEFSFFGWEGEEPQGGLKLTAVKLSEDGDSIIIRFYNAFDEPAKAFLKLGGQVTWAWRVDMQENDLQALPVDDGTIPVKAGGKEIVTIKVKLKPRKLIEDYQRHPATVVPRPKSKMNLPKVKSPPLLSADEVTLEQDRAKQLEAALQAIRSEAYILNDDIERHTQPEMAQLALLQRLKSREATLARQHYEARISALLNQQLLITDQVEEELGEIGVSLNWARVRKRVGEFLSHYYASQLKANK
jgi:mannosylglycerate hydrolase